MSAPTVVHEFVSGSAGGPGECSADCACGVVFDGFDTGAEANRLLDQHIADATKRGEYTAGLRMLADILDTNPHLRLPFDGNSSPISVMPHDDQRREIADWARVLPGQKDKGQLADRYFTLDGSLRGLKMRVICDRPEVCERVVVGTHEVTETVPDPALVAAVPTIEVTTTVEDVEWRCVPLLKDSAGDLDSPGNDGGLHGVPSTAGAVASDPDGSQGSLQHGAGHTDSAGFRGPADGEQATPHARVTSTVDAGPPTAASASPRRDPGTPDGGDGVGASTAGTAAAEARRSRTGHPCIEVPPGVRVLADLDSGDPRRAS